MHVLRRPVEATANSGHLLTVELRSAQLFARPVLEQFFRRYRIF